MSAGCSDDTASDGNLVSQPTATAGPDDRTAADEVEPTMTADPVGALSGAIDELGDSYRFDHAIVTPAGQRIEVSGRRVGDAFEYAVKAGGTTVEWITVGPRGWIREDGSDTWVETEVESGGDPLGTLATPRAVEWGPDGLLAVYDASALTPGASGTVEVTVTLGDRSVAFASTAGGMEILTTLDAGGEIPPVVAPS